MLDPEIHTAGGPDHIQASAIEALQTACEAYLIAEFKGLLLP